MAGRARTPEDVLGASDEALRQATMGLADYRGSEDVRRLPGLRMAIILGRTVTFPLQSLRVDGEEVDEEKHGDWYRINVKERLRNDPVAKAMITIRNEVEKQGILAVVNSTVRAIHISPGRRPDPFDHLTQMATQMFQYDPPFDVDDEGVLRDGRGRQVEVDGVQGLVRVEHYFSVGPAEVTEVLASDVVGYYLDLLTEVLMQGYADFGQPGQAAASRRWLAQKHGGTAKQPPPS